MSNDDTHPDGCMCDPCKRHRNRQRFRDDFPEAARRQRYELGRDTEPPEQEPFPRPWNR